MTKRPMIEVMACMDPYLDDLNAICHEAVTTYQGKEYSDRVRLEHTPSTQANCIHSHMVAGAHRLLSDRPGIRFLEVRGLNIWLFGSEVIVRFKKMDPSGRSQNYQTQQAKDYDGGDDLPGVPPPACRVTVGYVLDPPGSGIRRVQVARPFGQQVEWCAAIVPPDGRLPGARLWIDVTSQRNFG